MWTRVNVLIHAAEMRLVPVPGKDVIAVVVGPLGDVVERRTDKGHVRRGCKVASRLLELWDQLYRQQESPNDVDGYRALGAVHHGELEGVHASVVDHNVEPRQRVDAVHEALDGRGRLNVELPHLEDVWVAFKESLNLLLCFFASRLAAAGNDDFAGTQTDDVLDRLLAQTCVAARDDDRFGGKRGCGYGNFEKVLGTDKITEGRHGVSDTDM